jgi:Calpain family cysteine protease
MTTSIDIAGVRRRSDLADNEPNDTPPPNEAARGRAERAAADELYQTFAAGEGYGPNTSGRAAPTGRCPPETIPNPVLFRKEKGDAAAIDPHDIQQGSTNDCFMLAALAGVASTPAGQALIQNAIVENRNDKGDVVSYTVTLHRPSLSFWLFGHKTFTEVKVTVTGPFACGHAVARQDGGDSEIWPLVIEKAYDEYLGGGDAMDEGGVASSALEVLTGREATQHTFGSDYDAGRLLQDVAAGKIVVLDSRPEAGRLRADLIGGHSYFVTGTSVENGRRYVNLFNPWNDPGHPVKPVACDDLAKFFDAADVGSVR